ncbi:hypothetical protein B0H17DRAFT_942251 [Mycena rosella]|uniref:Uncharacterized protein n=1 Tax=Mycena rosella TaxID=1033263 RepID=A0AAD7D8N6_MYCRO|nr:hypothetical protein B0H17DRAFT_942251 [Mycena rosella]
MAPPSSLRSVRTRARAKSDAIPPSSFVSALSTPTYSHVSSYRSLQMELLLYSPSVKVVPSAWSANHTLPVFGDHDVVTGKVILDPSCQAGRLMLTIEGAFTYTSTEKNGDRVVPSYARAADNKRRHVFYSLSKAIQVTSADSNPPRSAFREVFVIKRRPSGSNIKSMVLEPRAYPFAFELPRSQRSGEEMPPTFCSSNPKCAPFEVVYQVSVTWESSDISENPSFLEVPIVLHPDPDFHSLDGLTDSSSSWLEMPLKSDRPISFRCAVTLPTSVTFSRASSIPYFVVFTTTPRSSSMAREIASDATISISVFSQVTITEAANLPITPPPTPLAGSEESSDSLPFQQSRTGTKLLRRVRSRTSAWSPRTLDDEPRDKPLPRLPTQTVFTETQIVHTGICIGFPKRPRHQQDSSKHPSLHEHQALPDGLHKAKIPLHRDMLPTIDWAGLSVKYYMDISVLFGQDELRARVPLRII